MTDFLQVAGLSLLRTTTLTVALVMTDRPVTMPLYVVTWLLVLTVLCRWRMATGWQQLLWTLLLCAYTSPQSLPFLVPVILVNLTVKRVSFRVCCLNELLVSTIRIAIVLIGRLRASVTVGWLRFGNR